MRNSLKQDECHYWHFSLDDPNHDIHELIELLSADEFKRMQSYQFEKDKRRFCISRGLLRRVLSTYTSTQPQEIDIHYTQYKKPYIEGDIEFNLSHTSTDVVIGVSHYPIGIDIETVREHQNALAVSKRFFAASEYNALKHLNESDRHTAFIHIWTQKEAIVKAMGKGVFHDLKNVEVSAQPPAKILALKSESAMTADWSLFSLPIQRNKTFCMCAVKGIVKKPVMMAF
jgi:4'-phosphopantetheinyl transferase